MVRSSSDWRYDKGTRSVLNVAADMPHGTRVQDFSRGIAWRTENTVSAHQSETFNVSSSTSLNPSPSRHGRCKLAPLNDKRRRAGECEVMRWVIGMQTLNWLAVAKVNERSRGNRVFGGILSELT